MSPKDQIIQLVNSHADLDIIDILQIEEKGFPIVRYLVKTLTGQETIARPSSSKTEIDFVGTAGTVFLTIEKDAASKWTSKGEIAKSINALLAAIRVHEVESLEWVYLPPEMRQQLLAAKANATGISAEELKRLINTWAS